MASIDKRPNGKFRARYREYPGGPQRTKTFDRKVDATRWLTEVQHRLMSGTYVTPEVGRVTLREWWAIYEARQPWRPATRRNAASSMGHVLPTLGDRPLASLRRGDVQSILTGLDRAPSTVGLVRKVLYQALQSAVDEDPPLLARNPVVGTKVPGAAAGEVVPPTLEVVQALHEAAPAWFRPAIVLGAGLGLRQAEASGLTIDRVDWMRGRTVRVDRQWVSQARPFGFAPPKSEASIRTIPAADVVLAELGQHATGRTGFLLHLDGEAVDHNRFGVAWRATVKAADVEPVRFHHLRHAYASVLISAGCSVRAVQHALGHSSAATTLKVYSHLWPGDEDRIRNAVQVAFDPAEDHVRTAGAADGV